MSASFLKLQLNAAWSSTASENEPFDFESFLKCHLVRFPHGWCQLAYQVSIFSLYPELDFSTIHSFVLQDIHLLQKSSAATWNYFSTCSQSPRMCWSQPQDTSNALFDRLITHNHISTCKPTLLRIIIIYLFISGSEPHIAKRHMQTSTN